MKHKKIKKTLAFWKKRCYINVAGEKQQKIKAMRGSAW